MDRRQFLKFLGTGALFFVLKKCGVDLLHIIPSRYSDPAFGIDLEQNDETITFDDTAQLALRLNLITETFDYQPSIDSVSIWDWAKASTKYFYSENIIDIEARLPRLIEFNNDLCGTSHIAISNCFDTIYLNPNLVDAHSTMFKSPLFIPVLIHEEFHLSQATLCDVVSTELIEVAAQIATWEVLAAMAILHDHGKEAAYALTTEMREVALCTAVAISLRNNDIDAITQLVRQMFPKIIADPKISRLVDAYRKDPENLMKTYSWYAERPLTEVVRAHLWSDDKILGLPLSPNQARYISGTTLYELDNKSVLPINEFVEFMSRNEEIVTEYNQN